MGRACLISTTEEEKLVMSVHYSYIMESWILVCMHIYVQNEI